MFVKQHKSFIISSLGVIAVCAAFAIVFIVTGGDSNAPDVAVADGDRYLPSQEDIFFQISDAVGLSRSVVITALFTGIALIVISILYFKLEHQASGEKQAKK